LRQLSFFLLLSSFSTGDIDSWWEMPTMMANAIAYSMVICPPKVIKLNYNLARKQGIIFCENPGNLLTTFVCYF